MSFESDFGHAVNLPEYPELIKQGFDSDQIAHLRIARMVVAAAAERNSLLQRSDIERINKRPDLQATFSNIVSTGDDNTILWVESRFNPDTSRMSDSERYIEEAADIARSSLVLWDHIRLDNTDLTNPRDILELRSLEDVARRGLSRFTMLGYRDRFRRFADFDEADLIDWEASFVDIEVDGFNIGKSKSSNAVIIASSVDHGRQVVKRAIKETMPFTGAPLEADEFFDKVARFSSAKLEIRDGFSTADM